jgi:two-component system OmpR family sensor kinase
MKAELSHSLRARLLGFLLGAIMLAAIVQAATAYLTALAQADLIFDRHMQKMALALRSGVALATSPPNNEISSDRANEDFFVQMWTSNGVPVFQSAAHQTLRRPARPGFSDVQAQDRTYRVFSIATPTQIIQVAQDMAARRDMARTLAERTVGPTLLMAPLLMLVVWWVVSRSLAPVAKVRSQMALRKADELSPLSEVGLPVEVRPLIQELNLLFERLRKAFDSQKVFVADAAHEMRSPLAALKIQLQGLQRAPDDPARELAIRRLAAGIDRAAHLVDQLLVLARQEASAATGLALESIDLAQVSFLSVSDTLVAAQARQIDLGVHRAESTLLQGHPEALRILVRNLLDNAVKYTPVGGTVDLDVHGTSDGAVLSIEDSGPGIAEEDRGRVLDRFYRAHGAGSTGSGLGLAIVKAIATLHDASVVLDRSVRLGGLRVQVNFERAASPVAGNNQRS